MMIRSEHLEEYWLQDQEGNRRLMSNDFGRLEHEGPTPEEFERYPYVHAAFACQVREVVHMYVSEDAVTSCNHEETVITRVVKKGEKAGLPSEGVEACRQCGGKRNMEDGRWGSWESGHSVDIAEGHSGWNEELVLAMTRPTTRELETQKANWDKMKPAVITQDTTDLTRPPLFGLAEAITIASSACSRCMNVLHFTYAPNGRVSGFRELSDEWRKMGTTCKFCIHLPVPIRPEPMGDHAESG